LLCIKNNFARSLNKIVSITIVKYNKHTHKGSFDINQVSDLIETSPENSQYVHLKKDNAGASPSSSNDQQKVDEEETSNNDESENESSESYSYNEENYSYENTNTNDRIKNSGVMVSHKYQNLQLPSNVHVLRLANVTTSKNFTCQAQNSFGLVVYNLTVVIKGNFNLIFTTYTPIYKSGCCYSKSLF
jgi:hypothetical protein